MRARLHCYNLLLQPVTTGAVPARGGGVAQTNDFDELDREVAKLFGVAG